MGTTPPWWARAPAGPRWRASRRRWGGWWPGPGAVLVCGGLGGVMEAACRGARAEGGTTVGVLPSESRRDANRHVELAVATGMGEARNAIVARTADAIIAVGGEFGTLSEIALALKMGKPVVGRRAEAITRAARPEEAVALALRLAARPGA